MYLSHFIILRDIILCLLKILRFRNFPLIFGSDVIDPENQILQTLRVHKVVHYYIYYHFATEQSEFEESSVILYRNPKWGVLISWHLWEDYDIRDLLIP